MVGLMEMKEELRSAIKDGGGQYVMTLGTIVMLKWCADNLDLKQQVSLISSNICTHI